MTEKTTISQTSVRIPFPQAAVAAAEARSADIKADNRDPVTKKPTLAPALQARIQQTMKAASAVGHEQDKARTAHTPVAAPPVRTAPPVQTPQIPAQMLGHINPSHGHAAAFPEDQQAYAHASPPNTPNSNHVGIGIDLPSNFHFYHFKDLYTAPLRQEHLAKLTVAHETRSLLPMVEAISSLLTTTHAEFADAPLGWMLTIPDFYYILYYHRLHAFTKASFIHTTECRNPLHLEQVNVGIRDEAGEFLRDDLGNFIKANPDGLEIKTLIQKSWLTTKKLESPIRYDESSIPEDVFLYPATMKDAVDYTEHPRFGDAEWRATAAAAVVVRLRDNPHATLDERVARMNQFLPDQVYETKAFLRGVEKSYGVEEFVNVMCKECGHQMRAKVHIDAHSFLPA